jgi:hypothetical protein
MHYLGYLTRNLLDIRSIECDPGSAYRSHYISNQPSLRSSIAAFAI